MERSKPFFWMLAALVLALLVGSGVLAQGDPLGAIDTLLAQAGDALAADDLVTAQALLLGVNATITDEVIEICPTLVAARTILTEASATSDVATAQAFVVSLRSLLTPCLPDGGESAPAAQQQGEPVTQQQGESATQQQGEVQGQAQNPPPAQSFQQGAPAASEPQAAPESQSAWESPTALDPLASPAVAQPAPAALVTITADNASDLDWLYSVGHGAMEDLSLSPDGTTLALGGGGGVLLLDRADLYGEPRWVYRSQEKCWRAVWSPDGTQIAAGYASGLVQILDVQSGQVLAELAGHSGLITELAWSPDGRWLVSTSNDDSSLLWNALTGTLQTVLESYDDNYRNDAIWSPDGSVVVTAGEDGIIRVFDGQSGNLMWSLDHTDWVNMIEWSPDGTRLLSAGDDNTVRVWDVASGREIRALAGAELEEDPDAVLPFWRATWSPDGQQIAALEYYHTDLVRELQIWDVQSGALIRQVETEGATGDLLWTSDNLLLVLDAERLLQYDAASGQRRVERNFQDYVDVVSWSPDGQQFATASWGRSVDIYDAASGGLVRVLTGNNNERMEEAAWSPDGRYVAAVSRTPGEFFGPVYVWDVASGLLVTVFDTPPYHSLVWSPDGTYLAANINYAGDAIIWDTGTWEEVSRIYGSKVKEVVFLSETLVAGQDYDNPDTINVVDVVTGSDVTTQMLSFVALDDSSYRSKICLSPDRMRLGISTTEGLNLYQIVNEAFVFEGKIATARSYPACAWSQDNRLIMANTYPVISFFSPDSLALHAELPLQMSSVRNPVFSPEGRRMVATRDGVVQVYGVRQ